MGDKEMKLRFQPKGSMCSACYKKENDCSELEFYKMLPIVENYRKDGLSVMIVKCSEFSRLH